MKLIKTVLFKIVVYAICIAMITGGYWMMSNEPTYGIETYNYKQPIAGIVLIIIGLLYPVTDILINLKKRK